MHLTYAFLQLLEKVCMILKSLFLRLAHKMYYKTYKKDKYFSLNCAASIWLCKIWNIVNVTIVLLVPTKTTMMPSSYEIYYKISYSIAVYVMILKLDLNELLRCLLRHNIIEKCQIYDYVLRQLYGKIALNWYVSVSSNHPYFSLMTRCIMFSVFACVYVHNLAIYCMNI